MENAQAGAPEKPETRLDPQKEAHGGDPNESPLQVTSSHVALLVAEVLNTAQALSTAQAEEKMAVLPVASNALHTSIKESEFPQKGSDVPEFPEDTTHPKKGNISGTSAKTPRPKHSNTPKSLVKKTQPKQGNTPKSSEKTILSEEDSIPTSLEEMTQPKVGDSSKASDKTNHFHRGSIPKASDKTNHFHRGSIPKASEKTKQFNPENILKAPANTIQSKHSNTPKSLAKNTQPKQENIPKSLASTAQHRKDDVPKSSEEATQPSEDAIPKLPEEAPQPREGDTSQSSEETVEPKEDSKKESVELPTEDVVKVIMGKQDFQEALKEAGERLVAVDFSATWCGPCRTIRPLFHSLSLKHNDVMFLEVDADDSDELVRDCEIVCLPTFHFYKKEEKVGELCGAQKEKLEAIITELK
ncbi:PREDICTED: thioredoxin domain-containing protein 2 isoform X3 [Chinchilla lanigera]|uniref:thioredoxin domain-containing protein 2 isoform X2 n=1 Tax=Chinchilla lanigera TaxID=34839 RepID=UPI00038F0833|nr:PREDICTED: thioredoxin domain-containing protein 2 isoform X2 [Chinchilla lanigera]XP_013370501.1 PREDICTED: thioredoxin domain-containing protein 2 isoform X3 [Chinchilla lanigera]